MMSSGKQLSICSPSVIAPGRLFWRFLLVAASLLAALISPAGSVGAQQFHGPRAVPGSHVRYLRLPWRYAGIPGVGGGSITWYAGDGDPNHPAANYLFASPTEPIRPRKAATNGKGQGWSSFNNAEISKRWIVWGQGTYGWQLWALNRVTGHRFLVDSSKTDGFPPYDYEFPDQVLEGNLLIWTVTKCGRNCVPPPGSHAPQHWTSYLKMRRLPAGKTTIIRKTVAPCNQYWPAATGQTVVWMQEGTCPARANGPPASYTVNGTDLLMLNRVTGRITQLTNNHISAVPTVNRGFIAWKQASDRFQNGAIVLMSRTTGKRIVVSRPGPPDPRNYCRATRGQPWTQCDSSPALTKRSLVWYADRGDSIMSYGLSTHRRQVLDRAGKSNGITYPNASPDGDYAVWSYSQDLNDTNGWPIRHYVAIAKPSG